MEERERKMKKSTKYLLIGTLVLFLSVLGASVAYYLARVSGNLSGRAAGTELAINVEKLSSKATGDLIPLDNDLETLNLAAAGYDDKGACVDINGYSVCQIYHITLTNNGSVPLTVNGTVTLSGQNVPNIDCARMDSATTVANNNSCMGGNVFVSGDTLPANDSNDYYVMVYINNLDEPQTDSGAFNGTVTFTTEDGRKVKGRFTKPFNLVQRITKLYNDDTKTEVTNNEIKYNYAANVGLMNDRLGGTTTSLDGGNIRYYGESPNNYIDIGDKTEVPVEQGNWVLTFSQIGITVLTPTECLDVSSQLGITDESVAQNSSYSTVEEFCSVSEIPAGTPILWRIIGVFDGKLRIMREESIGEYSWDTSASDINNGMGVNEWSQADLMKLLNPRHNNELVGGSLYYNSQSGTCYNGQNNSTTECDFTNSGLSNDAKEYIIDQTLYLGSIPDNNIYVNQLYNYERSNTPFDHNNNECDGTINVCNDTVQRTTTWTGKVALIYPSDYQYSLDLSICNGNARNNNSCSSNSWMSNTLAVNPCSSYASHVTLVYFNVVGFLEASKIQSGINPTLLLDSSVLAESGNGSKEHPYVLTQ